MVIFVTAAAYSNCINPVIMLISKSFTALTDTAKFVSHMQAESTSLTPNCVAIQCVVNSHISAGIICAMVTSIFPSGRRQT